MGNKAAPEKPGLDDLCAQIILAKADEQFSTYEPRIVNSLVKIRNQLKDPIIKPMLISELKTGIKGIPSLIYCVTWRDTTVDDQNDVQIEVIKLFYKLIKTDSYFIDLIFEQELLRQFNDFILANDMISRKICVKIIWHITKFYEYRNALEEYNPFYILNSILARNTSVLQSKIKIYALKALVNLASDYKPRYIENGIASTLLNILNESNENTEIILAIKCIKKFADDPDAGKYLIEEHFTELIDKFLKHPEEKVKASAASCIQALCKLEKGRESVTTESIKILHLLSSVKNSTGLAAKSALLSLCLNENKLNYFKKKKWIDDIVTMFHNIGTKKNKEIASDIIYQLSCECLKYTIYELYKGMSEPLINLIMDDDVKISSKALDALEKLCVRLDLQENYVEKGAVPNLIKCYNQTPEPDRKASCVVILAMLSIKNDSLLYNITYKNFFLDKVNQKELTKTIDVKNSKSLDIIEEINRIAKITCVSFPEEEDQPDILNMIIYVISQCESPAASIRSRSAGTLAILASKESHRALLHQKNFFGVIVSLLRDKSKEVTLLACFALKNMLAHPDNLEIWFKFDSAYVIDDSNTYILAHPVRKGELKKNSGLYSDWGKEFAKGEVIKVHNLPLLKEWTVSVWFRIPLPKGNKVLLQSKNGIGAVIGSNDEYIYTIDQKTGAEISLWTGIDKLSKGWHILIVTMTSEGIIKGYVDNISNRPDKKIHINDNFVYFGNDIKGKHPFGAICDLRVYRRCMKITEVKEASIFKDNLIDGLPDKYCEYANSFDIPSLLIDIIRTGTDVIRILALNALSSLATKSSCRSNMLRNSVIPTLIDCIKSVNEHERKNASLCLVNLG
jgi:Concanavalin A-like lectin/glucanases superfamily